MAENINITNYKAGKQLLTTLQQQGLKPDAVRKITGIVSELLSEVAHSSTNSTAVKAATASQQQQHVQPPQQQEALQQCSRRDLQSADAVLQAVPLLIPRGKFDCGFYSDCIQFTNKQTSVEVPYSSLQHVLIIDAVPREPNTTLLVLIMKSGHPVKQGKNSLDLMVLQTKDQPELTLPSPEVCQHLGPELVGAAAVVLSQLLASYIEDISDDTFLSADSNVFKSSAGDLMVSANKGAQAGWLVPLTAGLCYLGKQGSLMPKSRIRHVTFHRTGGGSATFDISIKLAPAPGTSGDKGLVQELGQIDAAELPKLQTYCLNQKIKMGGGEDDSDDEDDAGPTAAAVRGGGGGAAAAESDEDEDDEDFDPSGAGQSPAAKRRRLGAAGTSAAARASVDGGLSDDDSGDEEGGYTDGDDDDASDASSDPELVNTDDMSDMNEDDLGDYC